MLIVDAQVHVWGANSPERPWPKNHSRPQRAVPLSPEELLGEMNAAGVSGTMLVPPIWEGRRNDIAIAAARTYPKRFAVMARLDPASEIARSELRALKQQPGVLGLRFAFQTPDLIALLTEGHAEWVWNIAQETGMRIYMLVPQALVGVVGEIAARYPELKIVMDHLALTTGKKDEEAFRDFDLLLPIAKRPNVAAKVSALPCYSNDTYPYRSLHPYIRKAYDVFGPRRLFWGSDLSRSPISYKQNITMFTEEIGWLTSEDKQWIMGRGLCEWLNWTTN